MTSHAPADWRGLLLDVLRPAYGPDCTNNGISRRFEQLTLIGWTGYDRTSRIPVRVVAPMPPDSQVFAPDEGAAPVALQINATLTSDVYTAAIVPAYWDPILGYWLPTPGVMAGGNYAATSDSGTSHLVEELLGHRFYGALAIHDRQEVTSRP